MKRRDDRVYLAYMLDAIDRALSYAEGRSREHLDADLLLQDGLIRQIQILGEACRGISADLRHRHTDVPWRLITATRNRMVHDYFDIDLTTVWDIVTSELPALRQQLQRILDSLESRQNET
ncbi:MAG: DUF86 domain-containing protein [Anaerolineae bacterium]|nr:DUF86 domain-containing protein [Anaerolineae bacterium]